MLLVLVPFALAGWTANGTENDCNFFLGAVESGVQPVRAECDWPIQPSKLQATVAKLGKHADYFATVAESTELGAGPGGTELVRQVHTAAGLSDRETIVAFSTTSITGGYRYSWTIAADQTQATGKRVAVVKDTGKWEITDNGKGGSKVVYELAYDPGGSVPGFLVRWFQGSGVKALVGELRTWVEKH